MADPAIRADPLPLRLAGASRPHRNDRLVDAYAVTGTYATIGQRIQARYTGLLDRVGLYQPWQPTLADPRWPALVKAFNG